MSESGESPETPAGEIRRRLGAREAALAIAERRHRVMARVRLAVFALGVAIAWAALDRAWLSPAWILAPAAAFAAAVAVHLRVGDARAAERAAVALYADALARLEDRWVGRGANGEGLAGRDHVYAADLDLFGPGSLFERIARVRTRSGERTLAGWLLAPAAAAEVRARQAAIADLAPRLDLREDLAIAASDPGAAVDTDRLARWGGIVAPGPSLGAALAAALGSALTLAAVGVGLALDLGVGPLVATALFQLGVELAQRRRVADALGGIDRAARDLERLARLLERIEREPFAAPALHALAARLASEGQAASRAIHGLRRRVELLDSGRNLLFAPLAIWLSWRLHVARSIGLWREAHGPRVAGWLAAIGDLDALEALAAYAFERPADVFPEIADDGPPGLAAEGLGHPLLPLASCVRNDVRLGGADARVLVVSGSNMSGKSTLLRAIGTNAVLALAGAPVCAHRLRLSPVAIGASIRVADSLLEGSSRFHAELTRLKRIVDLAAAGPLLFLLDEILHGTNSHDRRIGAEAVVRALLDRGAIGLVTTHDLALAEIATPGSGVANVHFVDHLEDGRMRFDYRMRPGVVTRSNALELMRAVGLDVGPESR